MRDTQLYARILGLDRPWKVMDVDLDLPHDEVRVRVAHGEGPLHCPECGEACPGYDKRERRWRHLDTCQYRTTLVAEVPRVKCSEHGVKQVSVPWAEPGGRFTAMFEALVIDWLQEASIAAVSRQLGLSWNEVDTVMKRAVARGLWRREHEPAAEKSPGVRHVAVDEVSQRRGHRYLTVVSDREHGHVVHVEPERKQASLSAFYEKQGEGGCAAIASVTMDMWGPYIASTRKHVPDADEKIAFDKFHVAQHLGDAIDKVRRREHKRLKAEGDEQLAGTRYLWLKHPKNVSDRDWRGRFKALREGTLQTARAWAIRETAMSLWDYQSRTWASKAWRRWYAWAIRSRLEPVKRVARMVKRHLQGIVNAVVLKATNARAESINNRIQRVKRMACGFRNTQRFQRAIYFHLAALDLHPRPSTHTKV
jgi:transposase